MFGRFEYCGGIYFSAQSISTLLQFYYDERTAFAPSNLTVKIQKL